MGTTIYPIRLGLNSCYIIQEKGLIMIDGGVPKKINTFRKAISKIPIDPRELQLLIVTHGHFDHAGSARDIKEMTGARIVMHQADREMVEKKLPAIPPAASTWGGVLHKILKPLIPLVSSFPATQIDLVLDVESFSLTEYGIQGQIIHTPGHTAGSVSVLLDTGDAFVGCMAHNNLPFRLNPGLPIFAEDLEQIKTNWRLLLNRGAKTIYPGHGKPFSADVIRRILS
ncbi:MBL fold metallo-hydrolase [bacterium]|nr:MBL fold metallo-hydrolase [bacterium]RQV98962.1 MAG: MBL fold metallo-hydrolase [bacterium]